MSFVKFITPVFASVVLLAGSNVWAGQHSAGCCCDVSGAHVSAPVTVQGAPQAARPQRVYSYDPGVAAAPPRAYSYEPSMRSFGRGATRFGAEPAWGLQKSDSRKFSR
jgi:hypothetical protein